MKRKRSKHTMRRILQHTVSWLLFFTIATACTQDELPEKTPEEGGQVTLILQTENIRKPASRVWLGVTHHENINNIVIMGCNVDADGVERIKFVSHGYKPQHIEQAPNAHSAIVRMHLPAGRYSRLVVVTNAVEKFPFALAGQPYNALKQITYGGFLDGKYVFSTVPMYGELNSPVEFRQGEAKTIPGNIVLVRIVSEVHIYNRSTSTFKLERLHIKNMQTSSLIYYDKDNFNSNQPTLPPPAPLGHPVYDIPDESGNAILFYEQQAASFGTGKAFNGVRIIAEGTLKSINQKRFYPIDFVNHDGTAFAPVLRNHLYTFELNNITDNGYYGLWDAWIAKEILTNRATPQNNAPISLQKHYRNVVFNDHNVIATNTHSIQIRGGNRTAHMQLYTDFPGGWYGYPNANWITMQEHGNAHAEAQLTITCAPTSVHRTSVLVFYAGQLKMEIPIEQWP